MEQSESTKSNDALREARKARDWTQEHLAEKVGVKPLTIARWEKGESFPTPYARRALCRVFEKSEEELGLVKVQQNKQVIQKSNETAQEENPSPSNEQQISLESKEAIHVEKKSSTSSGILHSNSVSSEEPFVKPRDDQVTSFLLPVQASFLSDRKHYFLSRISPSLKITLILILQILITTSLTGTYSRSYSPTSKRVQPVLESHMMIGYVGPNPSFSQVVYVDIHRHIQECFKEIGVDWTCADLTQRTDSPLPVDNALSAYTWSAGRSKQVVYVDAFHHIDELYITETTPGWHWADLTSSTESVSVIDTNIVGFTGPGPTKHVIFVTPQGHLQELSIDLGGAWTRLDLTHRTLAPSFPSSTVPVVVTGFASTRGNTQEVLAIDGMGVIHEFSGHQDNSWTYTNLTQMIRLPQALPGILLGYEWREQKTEQVLYVDRRGHIQELLADQDHHWHGTDLTNTVRIAVLDTAIPSIHLASYVSGQGGNATQHVIYIDHNHHLNDLFQRSKHVWQWADLTQIAHIPSALDGTVTCYVWPENDSEHIVYISLNHHLQELSRSHSSPWNTTDLTVLAATPSI